MNAYTFTMKLWVLGLVSLLLLTGCSASACDTVVENRNAQLIKIDKWRADKPEYDEIKGFDFEMFLSVVPEYSEIYEAVKIANQIVVDNTECFDDLKLIADLQLRGYEKGGSGGQGQ